MQEEMTALRTCVEQLSETCWQLQLKVEQGSTEKREKPAPSGKNVTSVSKLCVILGFYKLNSLFPSSLD